MTTQRYHANALPPQWEDFWTERTDETIAMLDDVCYQLALWTCEYRCQGVYGQFCDQCYDVVFDLLSESLAEADRCYDIVFDLLSESLAEAFTVFGRAAYRTGRKGLAEHLAAEDATNALRALARTTAQADGLLEPLNRNDDTTGSDRSDP
jgi:hypothetical protein